MWGVFELTGAIHVAPTDNEGNLQNDHTLKDTCVCCPEEIETGLIVHNQIN